MILAIPLACLLLITSCINTTPVSATPMHSEEDNPMVSLSVKSTTIPVLREKNKSVEELFSLLENGEIMVNTERYGGFEQVGSLPQRITNDDRQMTTTPGDIVLYNGNSIVLFYGSNTWSYTKLGRIDGMTVEEIKKLLDVEEMEIKISLIE